MFKKQNHDKEVRKITERSNGKCIIKNCNEKNIYSHIISKSISIDKIAKNNHLTVFSPGRHGDDKIPRFIPAGVNDNPAFNGFCKNHDNMFELIDNSEIESLLGVYLQIYRTISSEAYYLRLGGILYPDIDIDVASDFILKSTRDELKKTQSQIDEERLKKTIEDNKQELIKANNAKNHELKKSIEAIEVIQEHFFNEIKKNKEKLENSKLNKNILQVVEIKELNYQIFVYLTDFQIPIAISTLHTFPCDGDSENNSYSFYIVVPYENSNVIIGVIGGTAHPHIFNKITEVVNSSFSDSFSVLNFVESLVISSPDDSFFSPKVIEEMSSEKLLVFTDDCMCLNEFQNSSKYLSEYDMSIFDNVRRQLINKASTNTDSETLKLARIPTRDDYDKRIIKTKEKILHENIILDKLIPSKG
ncbi:hypothetical protein HV327_08990 [Citrobacter freundii]|uniref:hypothetical protein n=1 Tax=Citrobacter freundii TaxID=546 RepID=UPI0015E96D6F|nr:hypothetical protein [Citrobacter freundii]QLS05723.1 hypothetical protein HV327_08990 [Citrobacter freundii]